MDGRPEIIFLPGMGADSRLYERVKLEGYSCIFLDWIVPDQADSLRSYAEKLVQPLSSSRKVIIGSSFGGVVALEMSKIIPVEHVVLIGAPAAPEGFSVFARSALKVSSVFGARLGQVPSAFITRALQVSKGEDRRLFEDMLKNIPSEFIPFAMRNLQTWKADHSVSTTQIVGERDWIIDQSREEIVHVVARGGHCLTLDNPVEVSKILRSTLEHFA